VQLALEKLGPLDLGEAEAGPYMNVFDSVSAFFLEKKA